jgi:N-acetylneuraminic acid mutarotase
VVLALVVAAAAGGQAAPTTSRLSAADRLECQTAIEQVYWRHRGGESSFAEAVPAALIRGKAEDAVRKSLALERYWGVAITAEMLQAELERMASATKSSSVLRELFTVLGNDAALAAECLARPLLADRLIRSNYGRDTRFHGDLRARARDEVANAGPSAMKQMSGEYREWEWRRGRPAEPSGEAAWLGSEAFDEHLRGLDALFAGRSGDVPLGRLSALREDETRLFAVAVLSRSDDRVRLASVEWPKTSFDSWWAEARNEFPSQLASSASGYRLPAITGIECRDDSWLPTAQVLDGRYWHTAVWTGSEMIVFGGSSVVGTVYGDGARYDPATDTWTLISGLGAPSRRERHVAAWTGKEMLIWGGTGDRTGGRYEPVTDTWRPMSTVGAPSPRSHASVVWTGKEMIVWGGELGGTLNTGARYNPATDAWVPLPTPPLAPRAYHVAVWTGKDMIVWAGYDGFIGRMYGDGARYNRATNSWTRISDTGDPNDRFYATAVWTGTEMVVWGGINFPEYDLSGGRYNPVTDTWRPTSLQNAPSLRWLHAAVWTGDEMVVQGGTPGNPVGGRYDPEANRWTPTTPVNSPTNGQGITAVWTGEEMILWGGLDEDSVFHYDGGRYDPAADRWVRTGTMNVPAARGLHSAVWTGSEMMVWGGFAGVFTNTGGLYDPATDSWRTTTTAGAPPGRENAEAAWTGSEAIFWGGDPDGTGSDPGTGGLYNPATDSWRLTTQVNAPTNRYGHTAVWTGSELVVFGGVWADNVAKRYRPSTDTWTNATTVNSPGARDHHGAVWTGTEMIVWGGFINDGSTPTGGRYNPQTDRWRPTNVPQSPPARLWPISVWTGSEAIFWGGLVYGSGEFNDGGRYDPVSDTWRRTSMAGAPSPRVGQGAWTGSELVLWGGEHDSSGGRYNPDSDSWRPTTRVNAPHVRGGGRWSTIWTGAQMIIWGGIIETQEGNLYCASGTPNAAPVAADDSYQTPRRKQLVVGNRVGVLSNDTDANGDLLTAQVVTTPRNGTLTFHSNGAFVYKPKKRFVGRDTFTYRASDGVANSNTATVSITVG